MKQFNETSIFSEPKKAVIVSLNLGDDELFYYQLEELKNLCFASNIEVVDTVTQNLNAIVPGTYIGSGKLNELKTIASALEADYVIFNDELSPSQIKNISEI
ncbi:MAG: GTPase HflX, partial [Acholeplasmataceae bacterium]|nr:GTPase HflX [Acholeplasmataceae bacterium]